MKLLAIRPLLVLAFFVLLPQPSQAGQFKVLKTFPVTAIDGANPASFGHVVAGGKLYGVTYAGGSEGMGVLYRMNLDGTGFQKLHVFTQQEGRPGNNNGSWAEIGSLLAAGDRVYGTTRDGSVNWYGGFWSQQIGDPLLWSEFLPLTYNEDSSFGYRRVTSFIQGDMLYGFSNYGGDNDGRGTIFRISLDGTKKDILHTFSGGADGEYVQQVILGDQAIYGVTTQGGSANKGTIFKLNKDGSEYKSLKFFTGEQTSVQSILYLQGKLYGISTGGGISTSENSYPMGFLFSLNTDGSGYKIVKTFSNWISYTALFAPQMLATDGTLLYITLRWGGSNNSNGGLVSIKPDGTGQKTLVEFSNANNGSTGKDPVSLIYSGGRLYGANAGGGAGETGTIWSYDVDSNGDPAPYTGPLYGAVTFSGSISSVQELGSSTKTSRGITTTVSTQKMVTKPLNNALVLERARQDGLLISVSGYSIVCTDTDQGLGFYAYKKGSALVSLESLLGFVETGILQAVTTTDVYNSATGDSKTSQAGTDKVYGEGVFLGKQVSVSRTVTYKSADAMINGQLSRYYPGTSKAAFFGVDEAGTEFVEGTFSIAAPTTIQVP